MHSDPGDEQHLTRRLWQIAHLVKLGYPVTDAEELADRGVDWHRIKDLIGMGCSRQDARRIAL